MSIREEKRQALNNMGTINRVTRWKVLHREVELTGVEQAANLFAGKIERSADAFRTRNRSFFPFG